jgi:hypothetical protein
MSRRALSYYALPCAGSTLRSSSVVFGLSKIRSIYPDSMGRLRSEAARQREDATNAFVGSSAVQPRALSSPALMIDVVNAWFIDGASSRRWNSQQILQIALLAAAVSYTEHVGRRKFPGSPGSQANLTQARTCCHPHLARSAGYNPDRLRSARLGLGRPDMRQTGWPEQ